MRRTREVAVAAHAAPTVGLRGLRQQSGPSARSVYHDHPNAMHLPV